MPEPNKVDITLRISSIKTLKFSIDNTPEVFKLDRESFIFNISIASDINVSNKIIGFNVIQDIYLDKELKNRVCELITRIEFNIINFNEVIIKKDKDILIPDSIMVTLLSISLSTSRGVLAAKVEGSGLEGVNMPVVNPSNFKHVSKPKPDTNQST